MQKTALFSAFNKGPHLVSYAKQLIDLEFKILGSAGTAKFFAENNVPAKDIGELVGPPILGHRVVTLDRKIYAAILADLENSEHLAELERHGIDPIHLVYVDLYPLRAEVQKEDRTFESVLEKIDIGGPTLLRAAAKGRRLVCTNSSDLASAINVLNGSHTPAVEKRIRLKMAALAEREAIWHATQAKEFYSTEADRVVIPRDLSE